MAITTLATLKSALTNWVRRDDLSSYLEDIIQMGEQWIYRNVRCLDNLTSAQPAVTAGSAQVDVPSDFLQLKAAFIYTGSKYYVLEQTSPQVMFTKYILGSDTGTPKYISLDNSGTQLKFSLAPTPTSSGWQLFLRYFYRPNSVLAEANALFVANPDLYLFACLGETEAFIKNDARVPMWIAKRDQITRDLNRSSKDAFASSGMSMSVV